MNYIIVGKYGIPSIKSIYDNLENVMIIKSFDGRWKKLSKKPNGMYVWLSVAHPVFSAADKILRWGCTTIINANGATVYNKSRAINLASNKFEARMKMQENNVPIPRTNIGRMGIAYATFPIIIRPLKHSKGKDFYIANNYGEFYPIFHNTFFDGGCYYSSVYDKKQEYRVHVAFGKILSIQEKPLVDGIIQANQAQTHESWRVLPWSEYRRDLCRIAVDAVKALGLDTGAVDVMVNRENREMSICICEVNTAPSLDSSPYDQKRYSMFINWLFRSNREWYKYEDWQAGKSYSFKNSQLEE